MLGRPCLKLGAHGEDIVASRLELVIGLEQEAQQGVLDQGPAEGGLHRQLAAIEGPAEGPAEATGGHLAFLIEGTDVFTGDVLFNGTVGGTRAPGHTDLADLQASLGRLLELDDKVVVHPGHTDSTTIGAERASNPFVRYFRGEEPSLDESVTAWGEPATLLVWGPDYDGGHKALVRWADGSEDIVGGSKVERA